jgi:hypothetical protein
MHLCALVSFCLLSCKRRASDFGAQEHKHTRAQVIVNNELVTCALVTYAPVTGALFYAILAGGTNRTIVLIL